MRTLLINLYEKLRLKFHQNPVDRLRQKACDTFICNGYEYKIVGKMPWDDGGWRKFFAYRMKYMGEGTDETESSV